MSEDVICKTCGCVNGTHGGCTERGHSDECHGVHTMYFCNCDCCPCVDTTKIKHILKETA